MNRKQIEQALITLAKMVHDGDETTIEIQEAQEALDQLRQDVG